MLVNEIFFENICMISRSKLIQSMRLLTRMAYLILSSTAKREEEYKDTVCSKAPIMNALGHSPITARQEVSSVTDSLRLPLSSGYL